MIRSRLAILVLLSVFPLSLDECDFIEKLTQSAFGTNHLRSPPPTNTCPTRLVCFEPDCLSVAENGDFERSREEEALPALWYGDKVVIGLPGPACKGRNSLKFQATTPDGSSASPSSQVFQVFDYNALVPEAQRDQMRRVRVQAAMRVGDRIADPDRRFGVRIDAYTGDPDAFPQEGDPETIPDSTAVYHRLATVNQSVLFESSPGVARWQPARASLWLPEGTDFFVVLLEAYEDGRNDVDAPEFSGKLAMDDVWVTVDPGNTPPLARSDYPRTLVDTQVDIPVLANDQDNTSRIDITSVTIAQPSAFGTATPNPDGTVTYTPNPGFVGTSIFTYTVADVEGLVSSEATVTVEVIAATPLVFMDAFETDPQDRWQVQTRRTPGPARIITTVGYRATGGNPGGFRQMSHSTDGEGSIFVTHVYTAQHYLPSQQGAIVSLNYTEDRLSLNGRPVGSRVAVWQGGQVHVALLPAFNQQAWSTEAVEGLTAKDFTPVPDFSTSGDTLWFGYERANTNTNPNAEQVTEHGIDNWKVEVFSAGSGTVSRRTLDAGQRE